MQQFSQYFEASLLYIFRCMLCMANANLFGAQRIVFATIISLSLATPYTNSICVSESISVLLFLRKSQLHALAHPRAGECLNANNIMTGFIS